VTTGEALSVGEVLRRSATYLAAKGSSSPRLDADLLVAHVLGLRRLDLYLEHDRPLNSAELAAARAIIARRANREPVAHIVGVRAFRNLELTVGPDVLVPRPDTETLVEWALEVIPPGGAVLDWGTGSGAIALALASEADCRVTGVDISPAALGVAQANGERLGTQVEWLVSDGFAAVAGRRFDVIVANPPYLSTADLAEAPAELRFEPEGALVSGPTGLEALARIAQEAGDFLEPGGWLLSEIGFGQAQAATGLWNAGFADVETRSDLAGVPRVVGGTMRPIRP
jgi:release factor glutamine methyltransferase